MNDLLNNPAIQAGVAPFLVALVVAVLLCRTRLLGLAVGAAFIVVVALVLGFSFESLTASRKLVLVGIATIAVIAVLELLKVPAHGRLRGVLAVAAAVAAVWVLVRLLSQQPGEVAALWGVASMVFMMLMVESSITAGANDPVHSASAGLMLGLCAGALAFLGASASLAQVGIALGAGAGAALLIQMVINRRAPAGWTLALPVGVIGSLVGLLAVFSASLRWWCLLPMLAIPWATRLVPVSDRPLWITAVLTSLAAAIPLVLAVALAWFTGGLPSSS